jgi:hypothetical protein
VLSGVAFPGSRRGHGHGSFTADFDAFATLDQAPGSEREYGTMTATYDAEGPLSIQVVWLGGKNRDDPGDPANPNRSDAVYDFDAASRDLVVAWRALPVGPDGAVVTLHTRWQHGGAGRSDVRAQDNPLTYEESECWDGAPSYLQTYDSWDSTTQEAVGDPDACVFPQAEFADFPPLP